MYHCPDSWCSVSAVTMTRSFVAIPPTAFYFWLLRNKIVTIAVRPSDVYEQQSIYPSKEYIWLKYSLSSEGELVVS
jgi:hypothetical protein